MAGPLKVDVEKFTAEVEKNTRAELRKEDKNWLKHFLKHLKRIMVNDEECPSPLEIISALLKLGTIEEFSTAEFITVRELAKRDETDFKFLLASQSATHSDTATYDSLPEKQLIILALFTDKRDVQISETGGLFLKDSTATISCEITSESCNINLNLLGQWIFVLDGNCIHPDLSEAAFIEVTGLLIPVKKPLHNHLSTVCSLSVQDAAVVLHNGKHSKQPCLVNVCGEVKALSEIFEIKSQTLFLITLSDNSSDSIDIIVRKNFLHWQIFLIPHQKYIITNLRPTTMIKGLGKHTKRLFVVQDSSRLYHISHCHWLMETFRQRISFLSMPPIELQAKDTENVDESSGLVDFQGTITNCNMARDGIFEVDNEVRLNLSLLPAVRGFSKLRVGTKIEVFNAHNQGSIQDNKVYLSCCMKSCIKIRQFSPFSYCGQPLKQKTPFIQMAYHLNLSPQQLDLMMKARNILLEKLHPTLVNTTEAIDALVQKMLLPSNVNVKMRNCMEEFLVSPHNCASVSDKNTPGFLICQRIDRLLDEAKELLNHQDTEDMTTFNDQLYWICKVKVEERPLVGFLSLSSKTGRVQITDQSGSINVVIACDDEASLHECSEQCFQQKKEPGSTFNCPFCQTWYHNHIIMVRKYKLVAERFTITVFDPQRKENSVKTRFLSYVQLSLKNALIFEKINKSLLHVGAKVNVNNLNEPPAKKQLLTDYSTDYKHETCSDIIFHSFFLSNKEALVLHNRTYKYPSLGFSVYGLFLNRPVLMGGRELLTVGSTSPGENFSCQDGFFEIQKQECVSDNSPSSNSYVHHVLIFRGDAIRWYDLLHVGVVYQIGSPFQNRLLFEPQKFVNPQLKLHQCFLVPEDVIIQRAVCDYQSLGLSEIIAGVQKPEDQHFSSISEILCNRSSNSLFNIQARILSRSHYESLSFSKMSSTLPGDFSQRINCQLEISTLNNKCIKLKLWDINCNHTVFLYMNLENISYPLGLLPGTVVEFRRLMRRISSFENIYYQYIVVSTFRVISSGLKFSDTTHGTLSCKQYERLNSEYQNSDAVFSYIGALWNEDNMLSTFSTIAFVSRILKVSLKTVCEHCHSVFNMNGCANPACNHPKMEFVARVSFLADDGTGTAVVHCFGELVRILLDLSPMQWCEIVTQIQQLGEIFFQPGFEKANQCHHLIDDMLWDLCDSALVKKAWLMKVKLKYFPHSKCNLVKPSSMTFQAFPLKVVKMGMRCVETKCLPFLQLNLLSLSVRTSSFHSVHH